MLKKLVIKNYVLIDELEVDFHQGLNILTGATGAGKSIILSALQLATGARADRSAFLDPNQKCIVELHYDISFFDLKSLFDEFDLEYDDHLIVRRELLASGKSRSLLNDSAVPLSFLKKLSTGLMDFHKQFDHLEVQDIAFHRMVIDIIAGNSELLNSYQASYAEYQNISQKIQSLKQAKSANQKDIEYLSFQLTELNNADLTEGELEEKEALVNTMSRSEEIELKFGEAKAKLLEDENFNSVDQMRMILASCQNLDGLSADISDFNARLQSLITELEDLGSTIYSILDRIDYDPSKLQENQDRLTELYRLQTKYSVKSVEELIKIRDDISFKLNGVSNFDEQLKALESELQIKESALIKLAEQLSKKRIAVFKDFEKEIISILEGLSFKNIQFIVDRLGLDNFDEFGFDRLEFLFSANKGKEPQALAKIASGGEMSRILLSIKSIIADKVSLPTLVFDEIDTGISGEAALKTGDILKSISERHQILSITHSPQVASRADKHLKIYKVDDSEMSLTKLDVLDKDGRILELATMLSGDPPSKHAVENAKELVAQKK